MTERTITIGSAPLRRLTGVRILATGAAVPNKVVRNADLAHLGCDEEWIVQRTGILERRHAEPHEATSDLAAAAARIVSRQPTAPRATSI